LQEALSNVARHARASRVEVSFVMEADAVQLVVRDDGRGLASPIVDGMPENARVGLSGMRERVIAIGGQLTVRPGKRRGVEIEIAIPRAGRMP
jgi:two-component system sensor histidine kinase UhpB